MCCAKNHDDIVLLSVVQIEEVSTHSILTKLCRKKIMLNFIVFTAALHPSAIDSEAIEPLSVLQGVRGQSGVFNWALRERNIQVRLYLKVVLKSLDVEILIIRTNLQKSNIGWPQQPPTEKVQKFKKYIS